jgi:hypothetical protein
MDIRLGSTPNPLTPNVGNGFVVGMAQYIDPPTEFVNDGEATLWRITHLGVDSHALHVHLFDVQVVNYVDWTNVVKPPEGDYLGWRETFRTNPMEDLIVAFKPHQAWLPFALPRSSRLLDPTTVAGSTVNFLAVPPPIGTPAVGQLSNVVTDFAFEYVWHCHMLNHEENDFMRPLSLVVPLPPAPTGLAFVVNALSPTTASVTLNWTVAAGTVNKFTIQRATNAAFTTGLTTFTLNGAPPVSTYTDTTTSAGARYYYRVQSANVGGISAFSNVVTVVTVAAPGPLTAGAVARTTAVINWVNNTTTGVTGIQIERSRFANFPAPITTTNVGVVATRTTTGLIPNTTYYYRVAARTAFGNTAWSNVLTLKTLP